MKQFLTFLLGISFLTIKAQAFDVDTILYNGPIDKRINLVILSEGYTTEQLPNFIQDGKAVRDYMFSIAPYKEYKNYFNVFIIKVPSAESGITHPATATDSGEPVFPKSTVNTYFSTTFDYSGIHRLVVPTKTSAITNVLASNFPAYDQVFVLANTTYYGGSGGTYATYTLNSSALEVAMHEIGHSFAGLIDEYYAGDSYAREGHNMTQETNTTLVRWKNWIGIDNVGIYPHTGTSNAAKWYKPHQNCKMQLLGKPYCDVCRERIVERIHELTNPIEAYSPASTSPISVSDKDLKFTARFLKATPNTLKTKWLLNNTAIATNTDSVTITPNSLLNGTNKLTLTVIDTIAYTKSETHQTGHLYSVLWTINKTASTSIYQLDNEVKIDISPNPVADMLNINYTLLNDSYIEINVFNQQGQRFKSIPNSKKTMGTHSQTIDVSNMPIGLYWVQIQVGKHIITDKIQIIR